MEFLVVFFWVILPVIIAMIAQSKGRGFIDFLIYGFLIWPVALVHVLIMARDSKGIARRARAEGRVPCQFCAEYIMATAKVCPRCQRDNPVGSAPVAPVQPAGIVADSGERRLLGLE